jgi:hypothetical protein
MGRYKVWDEDDEEPKVDNVTGNMSARRAAEVWAERRAREGHGSDPRTIVVRDVRCRLTRYDVTVQAVPLAHATPKVSA